MKRGIVLFAAALLAACGSGGAPVQRHLARTDGVIEMITVRSSYLLDRVGESASTELDLRNKPKSYENQADYEEKAWVWLDATEVPRPCADYHNVLVEAMEVMEEIRISAEELDGIRLAEVFGTGFSSVERLDDFDRRGRLATDKLKQKVDEALRLREELVEEFEVPVSRVDGSIIRPKDEPYEYYDFDSFEIET